MNASASSPATTTAATPAADSLAAPAVESGRRTLMLTVAFIAFMAIAPFLKAFVDIN